MPPGRPREFNVDQALDRALKVFWRKGFEGASLSELTRAMRISRPSLYAAFGDKEALFRKALDRYAEGPAAYVRETLEEPVARVAIDRLLRGAVELLTDQTHPRGCFFVQGALACGKGAQAVRREAAARRASGQAAIRRRLERAAAEGDLPAGVNTADLARFFAVTIHGMAVHASDGATRDELARVAELAMSAWPT